MAMLRETPFVAVKVKCPICDIESTQRYLKMRMFQPDVVEEDSHVVTYKWELPEFSAIRPNYYHIWHCPSCHYCDEKEIFRGEDKSSTGKLELIREKMLIYSRMPNSLIVRLGQAVHFDKDVYTLDSALAAHLLAIYIQELLSPNMRQFPKLARFYLRTAWLYREKDTMAVPDADVPAGYSSFADFIASFRSEWSEIPLEEKTTLDIALARYQDILNHSSNTDVRFEINVMNIIIAIHRRCGRNAEALKAVRGAFTTATKARQISRQAIQKGVNAAQHQAILNYLAGVIDKMTTLAEELGEIVFKEELPRAKEAVMKMGPVDAQTVLDKLRELKFSDITCRRVSAMFSKQASK